MLVVVSLFGCSVGAGLLGFYKLHLLQFISIEFVLVPVVLLGVLFQKRHFSNRSDSRQFVVPSVYQATPLRHLAFQLFQEHTNRHTNIRE